jgi:protein gp37
MADLFGEWVPDEWIKAVFEATSRAPQHNYLYLTKNPDRYYQLREGDENVIPDNGVTGFFGASACTEKQAQSAHENINVRWMSLEPIHGVFSEDFFCHDTLVADGFFDTVRRWDWIVVGAETGNKKNKIIPKHEWIESLVRNCKAVSTPIFMKDSLADIWNEPLIQEFPW